MIKATLFTIKKAEKFSFEDLTISLLIHPSLTLAPLNGYTMKIQKRQASFLQKNTFQKPQSSSVLSLEMISTYDLYLDEMDGQLFSLKLCWPNTRA